MTGLDVLRARYEESRAIKDAWEYRLKVAHRAHRKAVRSGKGAESARRNIIAIEINFTDAITHHRVALTAWAAASNRE